MVERSTADRRVACSNHACRYVIWLFFFFVFLFFFRLLVFFSLRFVVVVVVVVVVVLKGRGAVSAFV